MTEIDLADRVAARAPKGLAFTWNVEGEDSDFVRFNHGKVRQPGSVQQAMATLRLLDGDRHASLDLTLSGDAAVDGARVDDAVDRLVSLLPMVPPDPHLLRPQGPVDTHQESPVSLPPAPEVARQITEAAADLDLVGIYAGGTLWRGFADERGQRNRFSAGGMLFDYSLVCSADKAVKRSFGGPSWSVDALHESLAGARRALEVLARPSRRVPPGRYRAWLEPAATAELLGLFAQDGFSARAHRLGSGCGNLLVRGERALRPEVVISESTASSGGPRFQRDGFVKPESVPLIDGGRLAGSLVSPRSAVEYGLTTNGATSSESPRALSMAPGALPSAAALAALGTGVWISNLWYLNFSDRNAARMTGMTRFATFWVEGGELVAPLDVMRFDASWYDLFGDDLEAVGAEALVMPSASTYESRSTDVVTAPGLLLKAMPFTL